MNFLPTAETQERSMTLSIAKGIAIIAMVVGHAEAPGLITNFIYTWHMPLFFIAAGYFFSEKWVDDPWGFISRRFKKLYIPFVKYSIIFLLLHNLFHYTGILNEEYGNWTGGVTHPYSLREHLQRLLQILTTMSGYDEFMAGAFWFFRGLLVASIVFLLAYRLLRRWKRWEVSPTLATLIICGACVALVGLRLAFNLKFSHYPNGFWRETWGIFFFGAGFLFRRYEARIPAHWILVIVGVAAMTLFGWLHLSGMNNGGMYRDLWSLPLTGAVGFLTVHTLSRYIGMGAFGGGTAALLTYIGQNTMPVYVFHIISYKVVSLLKIWWYDLDFHQIGCHMVIHYNNSSDLFWVLYSLVGTALPLAVHYAWQRRTILLPAPNA